MWRLQGSVWHLQASAVNPSHTRTSLFLQLPATKKLIKERGFSNEHLWWRHGLFSKINASWPASTMLKRGMNLPWGRNSDINIPVHFGVRYEEIPERSDSKPNLDSTMALGVQKPCGPNCQSLNLLLLHLSDLVCERKRRSPSYDFYPVVFFFDSYHTFKIQVVPLRYYLPETLVNESIKRQVHQGTCQPLVTSKTIH